MTVFLFAYEHVCMHYFPSRMNPLRGHSTYRLYCYHVRPHPPYVQTIFREITSQTEAMMIFLLFRLLPWRMKCHSRTSGALIEASLTIHLVRPMHIECTMLMWMAFNTPPTDLVKFKVNHSLKASLMNW